MDSNNKKKYDLLGMPFGTANNKLRKMIIFKFAQELEIDYCFRCGEIIDNIDDLSIEHKKAWQQSENPVKDFFDLDNIAFSHLNCNITHRHVPKKLSEKDVIEIRQLYKEGYSSRNIAKKYNVSYQAILDVKNNKYHCGVV